jgi:hypothetical protein
MKAHVKRHKFDPHPNLGQTHIKKIAENALFGLFTSPARTSEGHMTRRTIPGFRGGALAGALL